jgi:hypothetical protein
LAQVTNLDYEPQRPKRQTDTLSKYGLPDFKHFFGAIACAFVGAFAATTLVAFLVWRAWPPLDFLRYAVLSAIGTGVLGLFLALPVFAATSIHHMSIRSRMILATGVAFGVSFLGSGFVLGILYAIGQL